MKLRKVLSRAVLIDKTVDFLEKKTDDIYEKYEKLEDCHSRSCEEERDGLRIEMISALNKLDSESKSLDVCEKDFHACSGQLI